MAKQDHRYTGKFRPGMQGQAHHVVTYTIQGIGRPHVTLGQTGGLSMAAVVFSKNRKPLFYQCFGKVLITHCMLGDAMYDLDDGMGTWIVPLVAMEFSLVFR